MHSFDELIVNLMRLPRVWVDSGIREAQLGDALGHGGDGTRNGTSSDGLVGGSGREALPAAVEAISGGIGKKDLDTSVDRYPREGAGQVEVRAPGFPMLEGLGVVAVSLLRACSIGNAESKAVPMVDVRALRGWSSFQGRGCGYWELK